MHLRIDAHAIAVAAAELATIHEPVAVVVDAVGAGLGRVLGRQVVAVLLHRGVDADAIAVAAAELATVDEPVAVVVFAVGAATGGVLWPRVAEARGARGAVPVVAVDAAIPIVVEAIVADLLDPANLDERIVPTREVEAIGEAISVVVDTVRAGDVAELGDAAELADLLAGAVAAIELPIEVVVDPVDARSQVALEAPDGEVGDVFAAEVTPDAVRVLAVDEPVLIVVAAVCARQIVGLVADGRTSGNAGRIEAATCPQEADGEVREALHGFHPGGGQVPRRRKQAARSRP